MRDKFAGQPWMRLTQLALALGFVVAAKHVVQANPHQPLTDGASPESVVKEVYTVPTRDGFPLKTIVFHLPSVQAPGPAVLLRTPYNQERNEADARRFAAAGYYAITQDCRGRF